MGNLPRKSLEIRKVLECLGFVLDVGSGRGGHYKYKHPTRVPIVDNQRPFITIPRHDFEHGNLHTIIERQLMCFGFTKKEIKNCC
jgi:predicted RNA binding protein YcfA (HicA-like mRNA interferase family)